MTRRYYENSRRDFSAARDIRETFHDSPMERVEELRWSWPKRVDEIGTSHAVAYKSDKWKRKGDYEDYKHLSEGKQRVMLHPDFDVRGYFGKQGPKIYAESMKLDRMPDAIAVLGDFLGIQVELDDADGNPSGDIYHINVVRAKLAGAKHPVTGQTFLIVYTPNDLCMIVTGTILDIQKDGIVG